MNLRHLALAGMGWLASGSGFAADPAAAKALAARSACLACHAADK
ncbi:hypothetical protein ACVC7V_05215 [Hydrogenophaga sp. A37]|nr:hypothetical protein [Hydrogenophaga sp. A37]